MSLIFVSSHLISSKIGSSILDLRVSATLRLHIWAQWTLLFLVLLLPFTKYFGFCGPLLQLLLSRLSIPALVFTKTAPDSTPGSGRSHALMKLFMETQIWFCVS